jgi:hypothetical protein
VKLRPFVKAKVDVTETALTLVLLLLSGSGLIFTVGPTSDHPSATLKDWHFEMLSWITYLSMVFGSLLAAVLTAVDFFEVMYLWHLGRTAFLLGGGNATGTDLAEKGDLVFSAGARAHVGLTTLPSRVSSWTFNEVQLFYHVNLLHFQRFMKKHSTPASRESCAHPHAECARLRRPSWKDPISQMCMRV